jgi:predicted DNA-binding transcriptional regulator AlpA
MDAQYPPLSKVAVDFLDTPAAAHYLGMQVCTLRNWSIGKGSHPIQPRRVGRSLRWSVAEIRNLLNTQ